MSMHTPAPFLAGEQRSTVELLGLSTARWRAITTTVTFAVLATASVAALALGVTAPAVSPVATAAGSTTSAIIAGPMTIDGTFLGHGAHGGDGSRPRHRR